MKISGSAIIVTGGASGIGLEFVRHTSAMGARVWALDRDPTALAAATTAPSSKGAASCLKSCPTQRKKVRGNGW